MYLSLAMLPRRTKRVSGLEVVFSSAASRRSGNLYASLSSSMGVSPIFFRCSGFSAGVKRISRSRVQSLPLAEFLRGFPKSFRVSYLSAEIEPADERINLSDGGCPRP